MKMKFIKLGILMALFTLAGCSGTNSASSEVVDSTANPTTKPTEENQNEALFNQLYADAIKTNEDFVLNGVTARLTKATTSVLFVGDNPNENKIGIRIYIDYPYGENIKQDMFKIVDKNMEEYGHIEADGLDFLWQNRGELGIDPETGDYRVGYIRASVPNDDRFLLKFENNNEVKYISFNVIEEE